MTSPKPKNNRVGLPWLSLPSRNPGAFQTLKGISMPSFLPDPGHLLLDPACSQTEEGTMWESAVRASVPSWIHTNRNAFKTSLILSPYGVPLMCPGICCWQCELSWGFRSRRFGDFLTPPPSPALQSQKRGKIRWKLWDPRRLPVSLCWLRESSHGVF